MFTESSDDENKALHEMEEYHKKIFTSVTPTEIKLSNLMDTCKLTMDKYMTSHQELVMIYSKLLFFYNKFMDLSSVNMQFVETLAKLVEKGFINENQMHQYIAEQNKIMTELGEFKKSLSKEYGIELSEQGIENMKTQLKDFVQGIGEQIKSIQMFRKNYSASKDIPSNGYVKIQDKLYFYYMKEDGTMETREIKYNPTEEEKRKIEALAININ